MILFTNRNREIAPFLTENEVEYYRLTEPGLYRWTEKMERSYSLWKPLGWFDHRIPQWFAASQVTSLYQFGSPVLCLLDAAGDNCITASLSDSVKDTVMTFAVDDFHQKDETVFQLELRDDGAWQQESGEVILRLDRRSLPYDLVLQDTGRWMKSFLPCLNPVPDGAMQPLYSSWYNFHQEPEQELLSEELKEAAKLGFRTAILDDGWQFPGKGTGDYRRCGDWKVAEEKFPDFKGFVDLVHSLGMKLLVWFPVPFVGLETNDFRFFKEKDMIVSEWGGAGVLDVRYRETREYIVGIYKRFVAEYGIDGLKLDFVDSFRVPAPVKTAADGVDCESIDRATRILMDEIYAEMTAINPDFLIEFRQNYIGTELVNHTNMLRVSDCAYDSVFNRIGVGSLRLLNENTAIHSDMLLWGKEESAVNCCRQMLNVMFSVPQISVLLTKVPAYQKEAVANFVRYWSENREILLRGTFRAGNPLGNYSRMSAEKDGRKITVLYTENDLELSAELEDVFNNTQKEYLLLQGEKTTYFYEIFDCMGKKAEEGTCEGPLFRMNVPAAGMCRIRKSK